MIVDMWQITFDRWHLTHGIWHITCERWHLRSDIWNKTNGIWQAIDDVWLVGVKIWQVTDDIWLTTYTSWHYRCHVTLTRLYLLGDTWQMTSDRYNFHRWQLSENCRIKVFLLLRDLVHPIFLYFFTFSPVFVC